MFPSCCTANIVLAVIDVLFRQSEVGLSEDEQNIVKFSVRMINVGGTLSSLTCNARGLTNRHRNSIADGDRLGDLGNLAFELFSSSEVSFRGVWC